MADIGEKIVAPNISLSAGLVANPTLFEVITAPRLRYDWECFDKSGQIKWREMSFNLVTNLGRNDVLDKYFKGSAYTAAWFLGLKGAGTIAAADTLASHAGWAEVNPYTGNRPAIAFGTTASQSNTATVVAFAITVAGPTTCAGGFVASVNTGTAGLLYSASDFAVSRSVVSGDTLNVTLTVTD